MKRALPAQICDSTIFSSCFDVSREQCVEVAAPIVEQCADEWTEKLPPEIGMSDGAKYGREVGECAGGRLYEVQARSFELDHDCEKVLLKQFGPERVEQIRAENGLGPMTRGQ